MSIQKGGVGSDIDRLNHDLDAHERESTIRRRNLKDELDGGWARDQQRTSIWLFRAFGVSLFLLFHFSLYVMLTTHDARHEHLASVVMEMILASVIAGFLGYMLAKPFEHRR